MKKNERGKNVIEKVLEGSIAEELEIEPGDVLISINGQNVKDIIDYKYLISDDFIIVEIQKKNGEIWDYEIEKDYDENIGLVFTNPLIDEAKSCRNKCIFCFIEQLPKGLRKTLYFKDDDSRLSFLYGNFITLTNLSDENIQKIIDYRLSPINISVHTTNPKLRKVMLNNKNAGNVLEIIERFSKSGIIMNCQIVLVPNINDGKELDRTLNDLSNFYPNVASVAVVPVGVTKYREKLFKLDTFDFNSSMKFLDYIHDKQSSFLANIGSRFVFASDEFYAQTNSALPLYDEYEGFPLLENGIGLMRLFHDEICNKLESIDGDIYLDRKYIIATGTLAFNFMNSIADVIMQKFKFLDLKVIPIENKFFGETITVSGLITGKDLINGINKFDGYERTDGIIIPRSMLKRDEDIFLDDLTLKDVENRLNRNIIVSEVDGNSFVDIFIKDAR